MKQIEIDEEVFAFLQSRAMAYVETPNMTLRRLLGIEKESEKTPVKKPPKPRYGKKPKTNLQKLIQSGILEEGQTLFLYDYRGQKLSQYQAIVSGNRLLWNGQRYNMSPLAEMLLKEEGYQSNSVRGPAHWYNADGISIKQLWDQYLSRD
jgi:hypothetical protein